jgi:hypothetical protein
LQAQNAVAEGEASDGFPNWDERVLVQTLRRQLKAKNIHLSWNQLREIFSVQRRVTASFRQRDGRTLNVRKSTVAEPELKALYDALALDSAPGGIRKLVT